MATIIMDAASEKKARLHQGKNKKKSWRKTDIKDVEEYLEDVRHQERTGGIISQKADESLFFVDKDVSKSKKRITAAERRRLRQKDQPLKCHSQLYRKGKIECPIKPNRVVKKVSDFQLERLLKRKLKKKEERTINDRIQANKDYKEKKAKYFSDRIIDYDLWNDCKKEDEEVEADPYYLKYTNKTRVKPPAMYLKKRSEVPAIEVPHAGSSYNPAFDDHEESWIKEMSAGLQEEDGDKEKLNEEKDGENAELNNEENEVAKKQPKAKTKKQHRKARERKVEERTRKNKKLLKKRENDVYRILNNQVLKLYLIHYIK
eukprot:XP_014768476.1 PREDICTED: uncharacterized protein CG1785-like [Octopus bimaculoides]